MNKRTLIITALFVALLAAYSIPAAPSIHAQDDDAPLKTYTLTVEDQDRLFLLYAPPQAAAPGEGGDPLPVVISMHGWGGDAYQTIPDGMWQVAQEEGFFVVYAQALDSGGGAFWQQEDAAYIAAILETLRAEYSIDAARIYAMGYSAGGVMSHWLGGAMADTFAAVAPYMGAMPAFDQMSALNISNDVILTARFVTDLRLPEQPDRAVPVLMIHGTNDQVVPYEAALFSRDIWLEWNACDLESVEEDELAPPDVRREVYPDCAEGVSVVFISYDSEENSHRVFLNDYGLDGARLIWDFFAPYSLPE